MQRVDPVRGRRFQSVAIQVVQQHTLNTNEVTELKSEFLNLKINFYNKLHYWGGSHHEL
jgi:hypothetical protein